MKNNENATDGDFARKPVQGAWADVIRLSVISVWALYLFVIHYNDSGQWIPMLIYASAAIILTIKHRFFSSTTYAVFAVILDTTFITFILHIFGSTTSQIAIYYMLVLIGHHIQDSPPVRRASLILSISMYATVLILERLEIIPWYTGYREVSPLPSIVTTLTDFLKVSIALTGAYLFLSISAQKTDQFIRTEAKLREATRRSQEQNRVLQKQIDSAHRLESLGRLAGGVAHDFNNLLTGILSYSQFLKEALNENQQEQQDLDQIIDAARRASQLTAQLLTFGRKQVVRPQIINLNELIKNAHDDIRSAIGSQISLLLELSPDLGNIKADSSLMKQVILNVVNNSREAMPLGGNIAIQTDNLEILPDSFKDFPDLAPGPHVRIVIRDNGEGIRPENMEKIFDPFFTTRHGEHASGLGLSSAYGIVHQADGYIDAWSQLDKGTTIRIVMPRVFETPSTSSAPQALKKGEQITILLVEDEEMVRISVTRILKRQNYSVLQAESGEEAIEIFCKANVHINLVLTDVIMPGISGEVLADHIYQSHPEMPVLFMSGYTEDAIVDKGILREGTAFLSKPFSADELLTAVSKTLKNSKK
ncbi:MAG: response regulator [Deltaproteobacteria bacterium]|nr:response regulator [Deltaproteobacteria bacterium]